MKKLLAALFCLWAAGAQAQTQFLGDNGEFQLVPAASISGTAVCVAHQWLTSVIACAQPAVTDISGFGAGVSTALAAAANASGGFVTSPVANANLASPSVTVNGQTCTLGSTCTVTATAAATLTFGTHLAAGGTSYNGSAPVTITSDATAANTASTIMARDGSGQVAATTFTGALAGNATTATTASATPLSGISGLGSGVGTALGNTAGGTGSFALQSALASYLLLTGGTLSGNLTVSPPSGTAMLEVQNTTGNVQMAFAVSTAFITSTGGTDFSSNGPVVFSTSTETGRFTANNHVTFTSSIPTFAGGTPCGTSPSLAVGSSDTSGEVTTGSSAITSCQITFANAYTNAPFCVATPVGATNAGFFLSAPAAATLTFNFLTATSLKINYHCFSNNTG